jgi:hypothetical protein
MLEMDALRATSSSPFTPPTSVHSFDSSSSQDTGYTSLIKYVPDTSAWCDMEQLLLDFYINGLCPGRTSSTLNNTYLSLLQTAQTCESTRYAILSLSAFYIREYLPAERERWHQAELYYSSQALQALAQQISTGDNYEAALATAMLLMHHSAVDEPNEASLCWSCHANIFEIVPIDLVNPASEPAQFMRTQLVLARTAQTSFALQNTQLTSLETKNWYESMPPGEAQKICAITGLSPQLLFIISSINSLAIEEGPNKLMYAQLQEQQLQSLRQWSTELPGDAQEVMLATAGMFNCTLISKVILTWNQLHSLQPCCDGTQ